LASYSEDFFGLQEDQRYSYFPELFGGVNSNSAAGAIAHQSDGNFALIAGGNVEPGASVVYKVNFDEAVSNMCLME